MYSLNYTYNSKLILPLHTQTTSAYLLSYSIRGKCINFATE